MKKIVLSLAGILVLSFLFIYSCSLTDLRTDLLKEGHFDESKGRTLLDSAWQAYGGLAWDSLSVYSFLLHDHFYGFAGRRGNPYPGDSIWMECAYLPYTFTGRAVFTEGPWRGRVWGLQAWQAYRMDSEGGRPKQVEDEDISFWLPTYQYFFELPLRLRHASLVSYAGQDTLWGQWHEQVFVSWGRAEPQRDIDQYLVWINPQTHRIDRVDYTIRDVYPFLKGSLFYKDFQQVGPYLIPTYMPVLSNLQKGLLHEIFISDFRPDSPVKEELLPLEGHLPQRDSK